MATAGKRITRKQLRQPDWFQVTTENALEYYNHHKGLVFSALAVLLVLGAIIGGWQLFKQRQNLAASLEFSKAMALYQGEKYSDAIKAFETVKSYRWSRYAILAHLYLTDSYLANKELDKAIVEGQRSLAATSPDSLYRQIALVDLATAEEEKQQFKSAFEHYAEAQNTPGPLHGEALLGKARCAEKLGDIATAIAAYKDFLKDNPGSPYAVRVNELEAKSPARATGK